MVTVMKRKNLETCQLGEGACKEAELQMLAREHTPSNTRSPQSLMLFTGVLWPRGLPEPSGAFIILMPSLALSPEGRAGVRKF